ncbi:MAG: CRTAC1 family protein [bacterium]|nr:CRTAC1 family protein [bacterium]
MHPCLRLLCLPALLGCSPEPARDAGGRAALFVDRTGESGLDFVHSNGMSGQLYFVEMMGAGGALVDVDNDGDLDVFLVQGGALGPERPVGLGDRLYRNDRDGSPAGIAFTDVSSAAGIAGDGYGMGVAVGDYDNDGWPDLYVTNFGPNRLWRNLGAEGTLAFEDVTAETGTDEPGWSTSATFLDFDRDGWLDLYVASYVDYSLARDVACRSPTGLRDYCGPLTYEARRDRLFRNLGGEGGRPRFEDVSRATGVQGESERGLGVVSADFDADGWPDLYVGNDMTRNLLWLNRGDGAFSEEALLAGAAVNRQGKAEASMGIAAGDFDGDGDEDLFVTHLRLETNTLYRNVGVEGRVMFEDATTAARLGAGSLESTAFGTLLFDFDNDGALDVLVVNGAVTAVETLVAAGDPFPLHQPNQLFRNAGNGGVFEDVSAAAGSAFERSEVSRGAAAGDVDNDGDLDLLITNNNGPARLLINNAGGRRHWLGLRLLRDPAGWDVLGARATVVLPDGRSLVRRSRTDGSYCSAGDPRLHFGLGDATSVTEVRVDWPDGSRESWIPEGVDRYLTLVRGEGRR